ncbi:hypothetical protein CSKR_107713 [Clonorchis sinensis]|uniref:Uncharacterized protein n=1 Tax=Clonorchis sinensis TaxID=79923 RepID=A0A3R7CQ05_CLOSI|nr:hypothetical protein CSKR_107713 [Clonorchis sinensis]
MPLLLNNEQPRFTILYAKAKLDSERISQSQTNNGFLPHGPREEHFPSASLDNPAFSKLFLINLFVSNLAPYLVRIHNAHVHGLSIALLRSWTAHDVDPSTEDKLFHGKAISGFILSAAE